MQKIITKAIYITTICTICALLVTLFACSELGKRYITVEVESNPSGAKVLALIDTGGKFTTPGLLGTTPTGKRTMHFAFGAPGAEKAKLGVRVRMEGFKDFDMVFTKDECYSTEAEALKNVKHIVAILNPEWTFKYDKNR
jgi:hypothetical protein